jgi:hypothetical protein
MGWYIPSPDIPMWVDQEGRVWAMNATTLCPTCISERLPSNELELTDCDKEFLSGLRIGA